MYSNTALYGGDAHIFTRDEVATLQEDHEGGAAASLCEHHGVTQPSDVFHVSDVASDWRAFLQEDQVCDECAEAWRQQVGTGWDVAEGHVAAKHLEQTTLALGEQHRIRRLDTGDVVEATVVESDAPEVLDDGDRLYEVVEYAHTEDERVGVEVEADVMDSVQYAAFVEYGSDDGSPPPSAPAAVVRSAETTVDNDIQTAQQARGAAAQRLQQGQVEHSFSIDVDLDQEQAEKLAGWLADRAAEDSR